MLPALLTLPVTVKLFWILMQLNVAPLGLLTVAAEPGPVRVMAQLSAKADVELPPMTKSENRSRCQQYPSAGKSNAHLHFEFQRNRLIEIDKLLLT